MRWMRFVFLTSKFHCVLNVVFFFWMTPQRLNFIFRRFVTICSSLQHSNVSPLHTYHWPPLGTSLPSTASFSIQTRPLTIPHFPTGSGYLRAKHFSYEYPNNPVLVILLVHTIYEDGTDSAFRNSTYKIRTPGNRTNERIQCDTCF